MDEFGQWMIKKEYAIKADRKFIHYLQPNGIDFEKQMLIGYMIEYLLEKNCYVSYINIFNINEVYDEHKKAIEKIKDK